MKCIIQCFRPLRNQFEIITLKEGKIYLDDGRYERVVLDDEEEVNDLYSKLFSLMFSWKQEYIGEKIFDGEKYLIEVDVNHKRKKYKIQNKFPDNWGEFIQIKQDILALVRE
jgi:hypothetical protein